MALRVGAHGRELRPQHVLVAQRLPVRPRCQHPAALAELANQVQTVEAGRDEQLFFFNDLGLGSEVEVVEAMVNILIQRVQVPTLLGFRRREHNGGPVEKTVLSQVHLDEV